MLLPQLALICMWCFSKNNYDSDNIFSFFWIKSSEFLSMFWGFDPFSLFVFELYPIFNCLLYLILLCLERFVCSNYFHIAFIVLMCCWTPYEQIIVSKHELHRFYQLFYSHIVHFFHGARARKKNLLSRIMQWTRIQLHIHTHTYAQPK